MNDAYLLFSIIITILVSSNKNIKDYINFIKLKKSNYNTQNIKELLLKINDDKLVMKILENEQINSGLYNILISDNKPNKLFLHEIYYLKLFPIIENDVKKLLIQSVSSDEIKDILLNHYLDNFTDIELVKIFATFKDEKYIVKNIEKINDNNIKSMIINNLENIDYKVSNIKYLEHYQKEELLVSLPDEKKYRLLKNGLKSLFINSDIPFVTVFENNDYYNELFNYLNKEDKISIINGIINYDVRKNIVEKYKDIFTDDELASIIVNFSKDEDKLYLYKYLKIDSNISKVIKSLKNDINKKQLMSLMLMSDRMEFIKNLPDKEIINYIEDEDYKNYKTSLIAFLKDSNLLKYYFNNMNSIYDKFTIIFNIKDENNMLELYNLLNELSEYENIYILLKMYQNSSSEIFKNKIINMIDNSSIKELLSSNKQYNIEKIDSMDINIPDIYIDSKLTFGVELESYSMNSNLLLNIKKILGKWNIKEERSISKGIEITSPILHFEKESLNELRYICNFMNSNYFKVNDECGGHIHFGFDYFKDYNELITLFTIFGNCEEIIYMISNKKGDVPRLGIMEYARPISKVLAKSIDDNKLENLNITTLVNFLKNSLNEKSYSLNVKNIGSKLKNTIEFRAPNGEIDFDNLVYNIIFYARLLMISKNYQDTNVSIFLKLLEKDTLSEKEKKDYLLDLLFENNENLKTIFNERYNSNNKESFVRKFMKDNTSSLSFK